MVEPDKRPSVDEVIAQLFTLSDRLGEDMDKPLADLLELETGQRVKSPFVYCRLTQHILTLTHPLLHTDHSKYVFTQSHRSLLHIPHHPHQHSLYPHTAHTLTPSTPTQSISSHCPHPHTIHSNTVHILTLPTPSHHPTQTRSLSSHCPHPHTIHSNTVHVLTPHSSTQ